MAGVNKVILLGRLGIDPEVRTLESGVKVTRLRMATSETYVKDGVKVEQTEWHNVTMWRGLAEVAEKYLNKGSQVYIEGKLRTRSWKDAEGNDKYSTEIVADNMQMLGGKSGSDNSGNQQSGEYQTQKTSDNSGDSHDGSDGLPF
jgi:single-strand DNA-binding protein